jgi:aminopeptidase
VRDQRAENLAKILVRYSTAVKEGETCVVSGTSSGEPLILAIYEEVLRAGGHPIIQMSPDEAIASYYRLASDAQLEWVSPTTEWTVAHSDVRIGVMSEPNTRALSRVEPAKQARVAQARRELSDTLMRRSAAGEHRWSLTAFPTHGLAAEAGMSLSEYEDFFYEACLATDPDPVTAWSRSADETKRLTEWIQGREEVHITAAGTDIRLNVAGRTWIGSVGRHNMPDGEFFTGPVEDSVEGEIAFTFPAVYAGRDVSGVRFRFEGGKVVDASAEQGQDFLIEMLDTDEGARRLGELGVGTNFGITDATRSILLDEKIGGTVHMAVGKSYPETGGVNESAVHWDMICDLRQGGRITVDGDELQVDGRFVV